MAIAPRDIINFREIWKKLTTLVGQSNSSEFPFDLFQTTRPLVDVYTYYVDATLGNDANDGFSAATPTATLMAVINRLPKTITQRYTINIAAGTYNENVIIEGFNLIGPEAGLFINGTTALYTPVTGNSTGSTGTVTSNTGVPAFITDNSQSLTVSTLKGKFIKIASGANTGSFSPIYDNTATTITTAGLPTSNATYEIRTISTIFKSSVASLNSNAQFIVRNCTCYNGSIPIPPILPTGLAIMFANIQFGDGVISTTPPLRIDNCDQTLLIFCSIVSPNGSSQTAVSANYCRAFNIRNSYVVGTLATSFCDSLAFSASYVTGIAGSSTAGIARLNHIQYFIAPNSIFEKTDNGGVVVNMMNVKSGQAQTTGISVFGAGSSTTGLVIGNLTTSGDLGTASWGTAKLGLKNLGTGVSLVGTGSLLMVGTVRSDTVTTVFNVTRGAHAVVSSTVTLVTVPTNEILLDSVQQTFTALDAASPTVLYNNYGSKISR